MRRLNLTIQIQPTEFIQHFERVDVEKTIESFSQVFKTLLNYSLKGEFFDLIDLYLNTDQYSLKDCSFGVIIHNNSNLGFKDDDIKFLINKLKQYLISRPHDFTNYIQALKTPMTVKHEFYPVKKEQKCITYTKINFDQSREYVGFFKHQKNGENKISYKKYDKDDKTLIHADSLTEDCDDFNKYWHLISYPQRVFDYFSND